MKKVSELEGAELDYWVAVAQGATGWVTPGRRYEWSMLPGCVDYGFVPDECCVAITKEQAEYAPSIRWDQGGTLIDRERIGISPHPLREEWYASRFAASKGWTRAAGPTPLVAAMRAFLATRYGEEVPE